MIDFARCDFGKEEIEAVNRVLQGYWLASGPENEAFEKEFAEYVGTKYAICVNSGSSANLLALASLSLGPAATSILTSACGFPATLSPILHLGFYPLLVDYDLSTHNIDVEQVIKHLHKVKAVILAHTMGNPVDIEKIIYYANILGVPVIEDCCEAVGTFINGKSVGSFGTLGTFSFYPSHQMTAGGGGGMIVTNDKDLMMRCKSMRDWGKGWDWDEKLGDHQTSYTEDIGLDYKYYKHYCYETIGYNFKLPEINAAFGREQLKKLSFFVSQRQWNWRNLKYQLLELEDFISINEFSKTQTSWFGYVLTIKDGSILQRNALGDYLESKGIRHRPFFAGNILRHRPFYYLCPASEKEAKQGKRLEMNFPVAEKLMKDSLFIGCHSLMTSEDIDYIGKTIKEYVNQGKKP